MRPRRRGSPAGLRPGAAALLVLAGALAGAGAGPLAGQTAQDPFRNAELPRRGELWIQVVPAFESWDRHYVEPGAADSLASGTEPLAADYGGPLLDRVYPGRELFTRSVNADAGALGYDSVFPFQVSAGSLDFRELHRNRRSVPLDLELGVGDRLSVTARVPLVRTEVEAFFDYDSAGATFAPAPFVLGDPASFLEGMGAARSELEARLDDLTGEERERAMDLLARSGEFLAALERRVGQSLLLPLMGTEPGQALLDRSASLGAGFGEFGISAPVPQLAAVASSEALQAFFTGRLDADSLVARERGWTLGEVEVGVRYGLLDTFGRRGPPRTTAGPLALRTTVGLEARLPLADPERAPFLTPATFLDLPVGDGQRDLEAALYQDLRVGRLLVEASARYGLQLSDRVAARVHSPDRPFGAPEAALTVNRDLGDYLLVRLAPRLVPNRTLSLGAEYTFWRKEADAFTASGGDPPVDPAPLSRATSETRHRLGIGLFYRASGRPEEPGAGPVRAGFVFQVAAAGSGAQTPVSKLVTFRFRVPVRTF